MVPLGTIFATGDDMMEFFPGGSSAVSRIAVGLGVVLASQLAIAAAHAGPTIVTSVFATGAAVGATGPDSVAVGDGSIWISYINGAASTGGSGNSTVVRYSAAGIVQNTYSIAGSVDGLKVDPATGLVWALQNQDGNSTLSLINPVTNTVGAPTGYAVPSSSRGYDDVAFRGSQTFLSYTNPGASSDPTIQLLTKGSSPLAVTPILTQGATGTNLATGAANQATAQNDPDSLKVAPNGDLMLSSGDDGQLIFVHNPGAAQTVSFLQLLDPTTGGAVAGLDDAVFNTASNGIFYLADTGNNRVLAISVTGLPLGELFASVGSLNELALIDPATGDAIGFVTGLKGPHGLEFVATPEPAGAAILAAALLGLIRVRNRRA